MEGRQRSQWQENACDTGHWERWHPAGIFGKGCLTTFVMLDFRDPVIRTEIAALARPATQRGRDNR